ncbi:MAG TPA: glucosamine-6-phosphate deaminase [Gracilimonas sp.]|uniref:glucosamine-6-phosphate deaminase n=1 Tax=Gracilimonas sp. TaxID=1974203 RepID=UPI002D88A43E|nr:glucosamine-6-phosphate deaminase [Gracilimonas sp.]
MVEFSNENIHFRLFKNKGLGSDYISELINSEIDGNNSLSKSSVLGLATGSSPKKVYEKLITNHNKEGLSFRNVVTFNLDEYYPIEPESQNSYHHYMYENLFKHVDIDPKNIYIPNGMLDPDDIPNHCEAFEHKIEEFGGIDLQLLGVGGNGHIGFNEPGSKINSKTRLVQLDHKTRSDAAEKFRGLNNTPEYAITMGIKTILKAKKIVCMAWGTSKAEAISQLFNKEITDKWPITFLKEHPQVELVLDEEAASLIDPDFLKKEDLVNK